jgi:hypothetical protein
MELILCARDVFESLPLASLFHIFQKCERRNWVGMFQPLSRSPTLPAAA